MAKSGETRIERDSLGEVRVPADALWGASTQRAIANFPISGERFPRIFLRALGLVKRAAALASRDLYLSLTVVALVALALAARFGTGPRHREPATR